MSNVYNPGDILFYGVKSGDLFDEAIATWTSSPFVHVAIALNSVQKMEALGSGIMLNYLDSNEVRSSWSWSFNTKVADPVRLHNALNWLISQKGNAYSWTDDMNAVLEKAGVPLLIDSGTKIVNCSGLATEFLVMAGGVPSLQGMIIDYHATTPAWLAGKLGVKSLGQHI